MGADQTPDPTQWSDDQLDNLLDRLAERAAERDDLDLPGGGISRRATLAGLLGAAGIGSLAANVTAAPSYGSATGEVGTSAEPITSVVAQTGRFQTQSIDDTRSITNLGGRAHLGSNQTLSSSNTKDVVVFDVEQRDDFNDYDPSTGKLTVSESGVYQLFAALTGGFSGSDLKSNIRVNNGAVTRSRKRLNGFSENVTTRAVVDLNVGDTVDIQATQYTGTSADLVANGGLNTYFEWTYLG